MTYRKYDPERDIKAIRRIWHECGWISDPEQDGVHLKEFFNGAQDALVATIDDEAECAVHSTQGTMRYLNETLIMGAVTAVTTSRIARKLGFARELTARILVLQAEHGHEVSALGMFEQGFYDKIGFGTGSYEQWISFDPATLTVDQPYRAPKRLTVKDSKAMYTAMLQRSMHHGGATVESNTLFSAEMKLIENGFGLGYFDGPDGTLSHFIWGTTKGQHGPYEIIHKAYRNPAELFELLTLIKSLADQVNLISMLEFGEVQLQDLLSQPFRHRRGTAKSEFASGSNSIAFWQMRILDLAACLRKTSLQRAEVKFNLALTDPIIHSLPEDSSWRGIGGDYIVQMGKQSYAEPGHDPNLPTLRASVNSFTRMWMGIRPASSLAITTDLSAEPGLLAALDDTLCLPRPHHGWDF